MTVTTEEQDASLQWIHKMHSYGDNFDFEPFVYDFFAQDAELCFAGQPMLKGHEAIFEMFKGTEELLLSMKHIVGHVDVLSDRIYQEAKIYYRVKGDASEEEIEVTGFAAYHKCPKDEKMHRFDVYGNFDKLHNRIQEVAERQG